MSDVHLDDWRMLCHWFAEQNGGQTTQEARLGSIVPLLGTEHKEERVYLHKACLLPVFSRANVWHLVQDWQEKLRRIEALMNEEVPNEEIA